MSKIGVDFLEPCAARRRIRARRIAPKSTTPPNQNQNRNAQLIASLGFRAAPGSKALRSLSSLGRHNEKVHNADPEVCSDDVEGIDADVRLFPLKLADVGAIEASVRRQDFLRNPSLYSKTPEIPRD